MTSPMRHSNEFTVIAVRPSTKAVLLDRQVPMLAGSAWYHHGCGLSVDGYYDELLTFTHWPDLQVGDVITQSSHTTSDAEVHEQLTALWKPRWQQLQAVDPTHWSRIINFIQS